MSVSSFRTECWNVCASDIARKTHNPIRSIVENIVVEPNSSKPLIALSIGISRTDFPLVSVSIDRSSYFIVQRTN
ncbi:tyrosine aminotransferase-like isoform X2 [Temnothorax americanus]|uniref:tyrosine aminotransferase-like isoform X2 n=1 Tax=Temnothorax americanus TaxID=1964332 RepID=UPI004068D4FC